MFYIVGIGGRAQPFTSAAPVSGGQSVQNSTLKFVESKLWPPRPFRKPLSQKLLWATLRPHIFRFFRLFVDFC